VTENKKEGFCLPSYFFLKGLRHCSFSFGMSYSRPITDRPLASLFEKSAHDKKASKPGQIRKDSFESVFASKDRIRTPFASKSLDALVFLNPKMKAFQYQ
jgi:hypothetical protein